MRENPIIDLIKQYNRAFVTDTVREVVADLRKELLTKSAEDESREQLTARIISRAVNLATIHSRGTLRQVINATGVVLHTNLGRAPLGDKAIAYINDVAGVYNNLEMNLEEGERGSRYQHVEALLCRTTGAEAALIVNNNAAAVLLGLNTLAKGRQVIVSRGQLIEIGGSFRIPDIMKLSGAELIEVGTTNKTHPADIKAAINENTGLLFMAHTSNFKIVGFTEEVALIDLVNIGGEYEIPIMQDLGSGVLLDLSKYGMSEEPTVQSCVKAGADVITFSGDKLLGGPQAGIIVGKKKYIEAMKKNQLLRALRVDKITIAALEGTLIEYLAGNPEHKVPVLNMLTKSEAELNKEAQLLMNRLKSKIANNPLVESISKGKTYDVVGGGAYPTYNMEGVAVEIRFRDHVLEQVTRNMRLQRPAIITRKQENALIISMRTLNRDNHQPIVNGLLEALEDINQK